MVRRMATGLRTTHHVEYADDEIRITTIADESGMALYSVVWKLDPEGKMLEFLTQAGVLR